MKPVLSLTALELALVREVLDRFVPDREVWAFGSRVTGEAKPHSDLDLALLGDSPLSLSQRADLEEAFSTSDLTFKVDLVDWTSISPAFRERIKATYRVVWEPREKDCS